MLTHIPEAITRLARAPTTKQLDTEMVVWATTEFYWLALADFRAVARTRFRASRSAFNSVWALVPTCSACSTASANNFIEAFVARAFLVSHSTSRSSPSAQPTRNRRSHLPFTTISWVSPYYRR